MSKGMIESRVVDWEYSQPSIGPRQEPMGFRRQNQLQGGQGWNRLLALKMPLPLMSCSSCIGTYRSSASSPT